MTALIDIIKDEIALGGPMPISTYMARCLLDPKHGYYTTKTPFGRDGDFITAPEISQMFGELIGIWMLNTWQQMGCPKPFAIVEAGPGRGTLMDDLLRVVANKPDAAAAISVHLIEASPALRGAQRNTLKQHGHEITWHETLASLPAMPTLFVANELLDALPFRQAVRTEDGWFERCVATDENGRLCYVAGATKIDDSDIPRRLGQPPKGSIFEFSPAREAFVADLADHLKNNQGAALLIDYGHLLSGLGDTFQAMRKHGYVDPLEAPGAADLTSHVDFDALAKTANSQDIGFNATMHQGDFLVRMGLVERAGTLGADKTAQEQQAIRNAVERLAGTQENQMGDLFKVLCLSSSKQPPFPFAPD